MWQPTPDILAAAIAHAEEIQPRECCGVVADGVYRPLENIDPGFNTFVMDMHGYVEIAKGASVEAIVHSHVYAPPIPSDADKTMCEITRVPWLIINWPLGTFMVTEPSGYAAPLVGRSWSWACHDCWTLVQDALDHFAGIRMPDFVLPWGFWERDEDMIVERYEEAGLVVVDDPVWRHCDIAGMQVWPSRVVNHLGIVLAPDLLLHQLAGRLSVREVYGGFYAKATRHHLRHKDLLDGPPPLPADYEQWRART